MDAKNSPAKTLYDFGQIALYGSRPAACLMHEYHYKKGLSIMCSLVNMAKFISVFGCVLAGCASAADAQDERVGESLKQGTLGGQAVSVSTDAYTYYEITADLRKCPSPLCGGWFVKRLNRDTTVCVDGQEAESCYAPVLDWSQANLSADQQSKLIAAADKDATTSGVYGVVRGGLASTNGTPRPELGRFVISEAWVAEGEGVSEGAFVRVKDNGLRCFAAPCPSLSETTLNTPRATNIAELDWTPSGLTDREIETLTGLLSSPDGILIAGDRYTVQENGQTAKGRTVTNAYVRLSDPAP
jgi:hypothetical protein